MATEEDLVQERLNDYFNNKADGLGFRDKHDTASTLIMKFNANNNKSGITINIARDCSQLTISFLELDLEVNFTHSHSSTISAEGSVLNRMADVQNEIDEALNSELDKPEKLKWVAGKHGGPKLDITNGGFIEFGNLDVRHDFLEAWVSNNEFMLSSNAVKGMTNASSHAHSSRILNYLNRIWSLRGQCANNMRSENDN